MHPLIKSAFGSQTNSSVPIFVVKPVVPLVIADAFIQVYNAFWITVANCGSAFWYFCETTLAKLSIVLGSFVEALEADNAQRTKHYKRRSSSDTIKKKIKWLTLTLPTFKAFMSRYCTRQSDIISSSYKGGIIQHSDGCCKGLKRRHLVLNFWIENS